MDRRIAIPFNVTTTVLELYPPEGVPSSATYSIWEGGDGNDDAASFTGAVTADSVSTTLAAAAGWWAQSSRRTLEVASGTGITVGRRYRLANAAGAYEDVTVVGVDGVDITLEHDLSFDYATGSTFRGLRLSFTVPAGLVNDEIQINDESNPWRVLWEYTAGGVTCRHWLLLDVLRQVPQTSVGEDDLFSAWLDLEYQMGPDQRRRVLAEAHETVDADLRGYRIDPVELAPGGMRSRLIKQAARMLIAASGRAPNGRDPEAVAQETRRDYARDMMKWRDTLERVDSRGEGQSKPAIAALGFCS